MLLGPLRFQDDAGVGTYAGEGGGRDLPGVDVVVLQTQRQYVSVLVVLGVTESVLCKRPVRC